MSRAPHGRCGCGVNRTSEGLCPHGCDAHRAPHRRLREAEQRDRERVTAALRADELPGVAEVRRGAELAAPGVTAAASWRARRFRF